VDRRDFIGLTAAGAAFGVGQRAASGEEGAARVVLEGVPYMGPDWQTHLDGPQDFTFPSCMRSAMVAADPAEPVRRAFEAAGREYRVVGNPELCEAGELPLEVLDEQVDADSMRERVCRSIRGGSPVIALGRHADASMIAGYEDHGNTAVGWAMIMDETDLERDPLGYIRMRDWTDRIAAVVIIGDERDAPPIQELYRKALLWAVGAAGIEETNGYASGLAAFDSWAESLGRDDEILAADPETRQEWRQGHFFLSLTLAEGRAFGSEILRRAADFDPRAADEFHAGSSCHSVIHDLVWRLWQTEEGAGPGEAEQTRFAETEVRAHLREIIAEMRAQDRRAVEHIRRALTAMDVPAEAIPGRPDPEALVGEHVPGSDPTSVWRQNVDLWCEGVPTLAWGQGKDCCFVGALEAALAPTTQPYSYADLMGYSGLAFRTRWFHNPTGAETTWGTGRWHPVSPHGEGPEEIAAISRATGWQMRVADVPEDTRAIDRDRLITDIVLSTNQGLPVVVGLNTDLACVHGYHIHSMNLFVRDYQRSTETDLRIHAYDDGFHSPFVFLEGREEPSAAEEALHGSIAVAARNGRREPADGFLFGLDALSAWRDDLAAYDDYTPEERGSLFQVNWWCLMHLADARRAAVEFLDGQIDVLDGEARASVDRALSLYRQEADLLGTYMADHRGFVLWWGGALGVVDWDMDARQVQQGLLSQARALEERALAELGHLTAG